MRPKIRDDLIQMAKLYRMTDSLTVLGGGNTAFAVAANLSLGGASVTLCELPSFESAIEPIRSSRRISLAGVGNSGTAKLHHVTTDFAESLAKNELVLLIIPAPRMFLD